MTETINRSGAAMFGTLFSIQRGYMDLVEKSFSRSVEAMTHQMQYSLDAMNRQARASVEILSQRAQSSLDVMSQQAERSLDVMADFLHESGTHVEMVRDTIKKVEAEAAEQVSRMPVVFNKAQDGKTQQGQPRSQEQRAQQERGNGGQEQRA
jgi:hypothetical protein